MSKPNTRSFRPGVLQLESREVPSVTSVTAAGGVVSVQTDNASTTVLVINTGGGIVVQDVGNGKAWAFGYAQAGRVDVFGGTGNDTFTGRGDVRLRMYGGGGADTFYGGTGRDVMVGGGGADRMFGRNGHDYIDGSGGNDHIDGGNGNDVLLGGAGDDQINGGLGVDALFGDVGNDVLVSIDDTISDAVDGGGGSDILWVDQTGANTDTQTGIGADDVVNAVTAFANADTDRTLNGDRIADPKVLVNSGDVYERFTDRPLFSSQGPSEEDLSQGQLGDCWLLAGLGSTARVAPDIIRSRVVDFGDGTYGVRLEDPNLGTRFFRVDNDLPVKRFGDTFLEYTAVGVENSVWVAIMEKAYAHFRVPGADSYDSLEGGFLSDTYSALGLVPQLVLFNPLTDETLMSDTIREMVDSGSAAGIAIYTAGTGVPLVTSHQFILLDYELDAISGLVRTVTLRNPWGVDGPGVIAGPNNDSNFDDAILTITLDQLRTCSGAFEWAPVT